MRKHILPSQYPNYIGKFCTTAVVRDIRASSTGLSSIIGKCHPGDPVMILSHSPLVPDSRYWVTWVKILYGDTVGWIFGDIYEYEESEP